MFEMSAQPRFLVFFPADHVFAPLVVPYQVFTLSRFYLKLTLGDSIKVRNVTSKNRNRWGATSKPGSPNSHVLTKVLGSSVTGSWAVTNNGEKGGAGGLDIEIFIPGGPSVGFVGPTTNIPAGGTATLSVSGALASPLVPGQTYNARLRLTAVAPARVGPGATHDFTVTVPGLTEALLTTQGLRKII